MVQFDLVSIVQLIVIVLYYMYKLIQKRAKEEVK